MKNTKSVGEYIKDTLFWGFMSMLWYRRSVFRSLPNCTLTQSKLILWLMFCILLVVGISLTINNERNSLSILTNLLFVYELYSLISYYRTFSLLYSIILLVASLVSASVFFRTITYKPHRQENAFVFSPGVHRAMIRAKSTVSLVCAVAMIPLFINFGFGDSLVWKTETASSNPDDTTWTIAENIEVVSNLREEIWETLSSSEKVDTLQVIANIERQYLGLPHELNVIVSRCEESTLASYDDSTHTIEINIEYFDDQTAHEMLDSICHESYHAYQHALCEAYSDTNPKYSNLLAFAEVPQYLAEFSNYNSGSEDPYGYATQLCEVMARRYAQKSVIEYYYKISIALE